MKFTTFNDSFTFKINNSKKNSFRDNTDYSALLDSIISSNLMATNSYLDTEKNNDLIDAMFDDLHSNTINLSNLKDSYIAAAKYLAIFGKKTKLPYSLGHTYYIDGIPFIFHLDSIEIDGNEYYFDNLLTTKFPKKTQSLIIKIATNNPKINININC